jgi:hypothetical protein
MSCVVIAGCPARRGTHEGQGSTTVHEKLSGPRASAFVIEGADQLLAGAVADGAIGDVRMENAQVVVVLSAIGSRKRGRAQSGGNILDLGLRRDGKDELGGIFTYFDDSYPRQAVYDDLAIVEPGGKGVRAVVEVRGHDSELKTLRVTTRYVLEPAGLGVRIETTLRNDGASAVEDFEVGDAYQWAAARHFVPGPGYDLSRERQSSLWLAGVGQEVSYATPAVGEPFWTIHGGAWSDTLIDTFSLAPGQERSYERSVLVGRTLADVAALAHEARGDKLYTLSGQVVEQGGARVGDLSLRLSRGEGGSSEDGWKGGHWLDVRADERGHFSVRVPAGDWVIRSSGGARGGEALRVVVAGDRTVTVEVTQPGRVRVQVTAEGAPSAHRLEVIGREDTATPHFGPADRARGMNRVASHEGTYDLSLAPGQYTVHVSRGPEWRLVTRELVVTPGPAVALDVTLERAFDTPGWVAGDFHQHSAPSHDSATPLRDRVSSNLAEGVEILGSSDHNHVTDFTRVIAQMGLAGELVHVVGNEVTTRKIGHFNTFPLTADPDAPAGGAIYAHGLSPEELFARMRASRGLGDPKSPDYVAPIIQVNHPRAGRMGYFDQLDVAPGTVQTADERIRWNFEAIEILNGRHVGSALRTAEDWFAILNAGGLVTAMGNSDTHVIHRTEAGMARTWLRIDGEVTPRSIAAAVRSRRAIVSNGPFVTLTLGKASIGDIVAPGAPGAMMPMRVQVYAAPWVPVSEVRLIRSGAVIQRWDLQRTADALRLDATVMVRADKASWYVALVRGRRKMRPVYPVTAFALTNPIWIGELAE